MLDPIIMNARLPGDDKFGHAMLNRMNDRHKPLHKWALEHVSMDRERRILDIGFGGGQNIKNMCRLAPQAKIYGIDPSEASCKKCARHNEAAMAAGRVELTLGSAEQLPYEKNFFGLVTAFETVYYWPDIEGCFRNVYEVLQPKGAFLICNEDTDADSDPDIAKALQMRFYSLEELEALLLKAGFRTVHTYSHPEGSWICAVGIK